MTSLFPQPPEDFIGPSSPHDPDFRPCVDYLTVTSGREFEQRDSTAQAQVRALNAQEMARVAAEHGAFIRADDLKTWRPTTRTRGDLQGSYECVTCIATDGLRGLFVHDNSHPSAGRSFMAHIANFIWHRKLISVVELGDSIMLYSKNRGAPPAVYTTSTSKTFWEDELPEKYSERLKPKVRVPRVKERIADLLEDIL